MRPLSDGVAVSIRLSPRARRERFEGLRADDAGAVRACIAVTAPPVDGQANEALIRFLAKLWRIPRSRLSLAAGAASREKTVHVAGDPAGLVATLTEWATAHDR